MYSVVLQIPSSEILCRSVEVCRNVQEKTAVQQGPISVYLGIRNELQVTYMRASSESTWFFSSVETPVSFYIYIPALSQAQWLQCCYRALQNLGAAFQTSWVKKNLKLLYPIFKNSTAATSWAKVGHTLWFWTRLDVIETSCCSLSVQATSSHLSHWNRTLSMFMVLCW